MSERNPKSTGSSEARPQSKGASKGPSKGTIRPAEAGTLPDPKGELDFAKLDLTVERVDERLSPSETNIFDK